MIKSKAMVRVEIYRLKEGGSQEIIATCYLEENTAICEGDTKFIERLAREGILDRSVKPPEKIYPTDGRRFLEALKNHFNSGYLTASSLLDSESSTGTI